MQRSASAPVATRVAVIGAGHVGSTTAYALMLRALFEEIVLVDNDRPRAQAEAADIADANALARPTRVWAGDYSDAAGAAIVVLTAGATTTADQDRLSVAATSARVVRTCVEQLVGAGFNGILLVAANPVDVMTSIALRSSGLRPERIIGTGTLLDTARLRQTLAQRLDLSAAAVDALVLGEHGDSAVIATSAIRIGGMPLHAFSPGASADPRALVAEVREAGYQIISGKGYTSFGIATAIVRLCEAIVRNEHAVLPCSTFLRGQYGLRDVCLSLPCILGSGGVIRTLEPTLDEDERAALTHSANVIASASNALGPDLIKATDIT